jgi:hypothetical protein
MSEQGLELRIHQLLMTSGEDRVGPMRAIELALRERYKTPKQFDELLNAAVRFFMEGHKRFISELKRTTLELPEPTQGLLFDIPGLIFIETDEGPMFIQREVATLGEVREWDRYAVQHHAVQKMRFERLTKQLEIVKDIDDSVPWKDAHDIMENRHRQIREVAS